MADESTTQDERNHAAAVAFEDTVADYEHKKAVGDEAEDTDPRKYLYFDDEVLGRLEALGWNRRSGVVRLIPLAVCTV